MDITNVSNEQKSSAAVAWLTKNMESAPEATVKLLQRLITVNNEGMELVKEMQQLDQKRQQIDAQIGHKIGGAKELFIIIADMLTEGQIDEFASKYELPNQAQQQVIQPGQTPNVDIAGSTAPQSPIIKPGA